MDDLVLPSLPDWHRWADAGVYPLDVLTPLKERARASGLWNLFLPSLRSDQPGTGLSNLDYAPLAEIMGRVPWSAEVFNCSAPDTGNIELLQRYASPVQVREWLNPLLAGEIRSCFAMSEPDVGSSDPTQWQTRIHRDGEHCVLNGRKWFISGAAHPLCKLVVVMGVSDDSPTAPTRARHTLLLVPMDAPGLVVERNIPVMDHLALMCERALERGVFGERLGHFANVQDWIAHSRVEIDQARWLVLHAAWRMDREGNAAARTDVAAIKLVTAQLQTRVLDRAMQVFGAMGLTPDTPLARLWSWGRALRFLDGPDEVHLRSIARHELAHAKAHPGAGAPWLRRWMPQPED
jgi:acyl-CoA dehydrogenase